MRPLYHLLGARSRASELEPFGVIDIGSNSVRLVVYEGAVRSLTPLFNEKALCGLGRSVATTGRLDPDAVECALAALTRFRAIARVLGVKNVRAIATAAARDAANGADFIARASIACGARIDVLRGEKEAELAAQGVRMGFARADGVAGDLGGGSLELIDISEERLADATTLPVGGLRLIDASARAMDKALAIVDAELDRAAWLGQGRGRPFYAIGGTWRSIARLHMAENDYPLRVIDGYAISAPEAAAFCEAVRRAKKTAALPGIDGVAKARRETLPYGALVLERLLRRVEPSRVIFSIFGIREGLVYSLLPAHERRKDPLLVFCEEYARQRSRSPAHARELCDWTDAIFSGAGPEEAEGERRLRHAACLVSDTGWQAHPDYRGEQSFNALAYSALGGTDHAGRIFLALAIFFRHAGPSETNGETPPDGLVSTVTKRAVKRARIVGAAIRVAHMLSVGQAGVIGETPLTHDKDMLVLTLPKPYAALDGERLRARLAMLADLLGKRSEIRFDA